MISPYFMISLFKICLLHMQDQPYVYICACNIVAHLMFQIFHIIYFTCYKFAILFGIYTFAPIIWLTFHAFMGFYPYIYTAHTYSTYAAPLQYSCTPMYILVCKLTIGCLLYLSLAIHDLYQLVLSWLLLRHRFSFSYSISVYLYYAPYFMIFFFAVLITIAPNFTESL